MYGGTTERKLVHNICTYLRSLISVYAKIYINFRTPGMKSNNPTEIDIYFLLWNWKKACKKKRAKGLP